MKVATSILVLRFIILVHLVSVPNHKFMLLIDLIDNEFILREILKSAIFKIFQELPPPVSRLRQLHYDRDKIFKKKKAVLRARTETA
jgi:hypothetical protein